MEQARITKYFPVARKGVSAPSKTPGTARKLEETPEIRSPIPKPPSTTPKQLQSESRDVHCTTPVGAQSPPGVYPWAPKRLSRGQRMVQMARQKELAKTPTKRPPSPTQTREESDTVTTSKRRRLTARRRLLPLYEDSESSDQRLSSIVSDHASCSTVSVQTSSSTVLDQTDEEATSSREPKLHEFKFLEFESPKKKEKARALPSSCDQSEADEQLPLPTSYCLLKEKFHCTDTVLSMLHKRKEICTFYKLKKGVEKMMRRHFEEKDLRMMKHVCPDAYTFRWETDIPGVYSAGRHYHLTIAFSTPNMQLSASSLVARRRTFHNKLLAVVKKHHQDFLSKLDPPLTIPDQKVLRWHASFSPDSVPAIEEAALPPPPVTGHVASAKEVLTARLNPQKESAQKSPEKNPSSQDDPALKGVSTELLDRIRAKEAKRALGNITRDSVRQKHLQMLSQLPDIVRILRGLFVAERKVAIAWDQVVKKIAESHTTLPQDQIEEHLSYLIEVSKGWAMTASIKKVKYLKIKKEVDVKLVFKLLKDKQKTLEES